MVPPMFTRYFASCVLLSMPLRQFPEDSTQICIEKVVKSVRPKIGDIMGVRDLQVEVKPPCVPPSSLQTRYSDGSSGEPGWRWLLERSRTFLTF